MEASWYFPLNSSSHVQAVETQMEKGCYIFTSDRGEIMKRQVNSGIRDTALHGMS